MTSLNRKRIIVYVSPAAFFAVIVLSCAFLSKIGIKSVSWYFPFVASVPVLLIWICSKKNDNSIIKRYGKISLYLLLPYIVGVMYTVILSYYTMDGVNPSFRALSVTIQRVYLIFIAISMREMFEEKSLDYLSNALILSYLYTLVVAIKSIGVKRTLLYAGTVFASEISINHPWFEMHDVGLSVGMLILYEVMMRPRRRYPVILLLVFVMYFCYKRIAFVALAITLVLWIVGMREKQISQRLWISVLFGAMFVSCVLYIVLLSNDSLYGMAESFGVSFSNRRHLFSYVRRLYEFSPAFMGHGMGFTAKYMQSIRGTSAGFFTLNAGALHNDILNTYIDIGFWGSIFWFMWVMFFIPRMIIKKHGERAGLVYCLITAYAYIVYTTDNAATYFAFQIINISIIMHGCLKRHAAISPLIFEPNYRTQEVRTTADVLTGISS